MVNQKEKAKKEDFAMQSQQPFSGGIYLTREQRTKNLTTFTSITFMTGLAVGIFNVFLNPYFLEIRNSVKLIGIILGLGNLFYVLGLLLSNFLYEKIGYKVVLIIAFIINSFGFLIFTFSPQQIIPYKIVWIIIAIFLLYFGFALSEAPFNILLTESAGEKKKGKFAAIISIASRIGEIIIDFLIPVIAYYIIFTNITRAYFFIASTGLYVISSILIIIYTTDTSKYYNKQCALAKLENKNNDVNVVKKESMEIYKQKTTKQSNGTIQLFVNSIKDRWTRRLAVIFFFDALVWSIGSGIYFAGLLDKELLGDYHFTDKTLGILMLIFNVTVLAFQFPAGWITDRIGARVILISAELLGILWGTTTIIFVFFPMHFWIIIISRIFLGIHVALWIPSSIVITTNVPKEKKSKVYNALAIYRTIGFIPGGFIAAYIYDSIALPYGYITSLLIFITGLTILTPIFLTISNAPKKETPTIEKELKN